jgi:hypothetical protein
LAREKILGKTFSKKNWQQRHDSFKNIVLGKAFFVRKQQAAQAGG